MTATLTDRYVRTVLRRVPERQRDDIDRELRAAIDDAMEARLDAGEARETAEAGTLTELGDPDRLADRYADRPQYLIGPELFPVWRRIALLLCTVVLPIVVAVAAASAFFEDDLTIGTVIGRTVGAAFTTAAHMAFWSVAVFAVLERTGVTRSSLGAGWTLDDLPRYEPGAPTLTQVSSHVLWPVILIVLLIVQQTGLMEVPVLDPAGWSSWWPYLIGVFVLEIGYAMWLHRRGAWSHTVTAVNAVINALATVPVVWLLATDRFFNPEFLVRYDWGTGDVFNTITSGVMAGVVIIGIWDVVETAVRAEKARRGLPVKEKSYSL